MSLIKKTDLIFVAGHSGMVGNSILRQLIKKGYKNLILPTRKDLDLLDSESVKNWFQTNKPNVVILAAAKVGGIEANFRYPADFILENLKIQTNIIDNSWQNDVERFLFLGSSCIYPKLSPQPIKEEYLLTGPLEITNESYAIAKIAGIKLCAALKKQYGFDAISLMPTNLYGPGDNYHPSNSHVLPALIKKFYDAKVNNSPTVTCWGSGNPRREFLYVDDLAEASIYILENISKKNEILINEKTNPYGIINIGSGKDIAIRELSDLVAQEIGFKGDIVWDSSKPDGTERKLLNISKANKLGWFPKTSLEEGIKRTIDNYKKELKENTIRK